MRKRIFFNMLLLTVISLLLTSAALCVVFYLQLSSSVQTELRERAIILKNTVTAENYATLSISDMRLTIIAPDGEVLFDDDQKAEALKNHANREEIKEAFSSGIGESRRFSSTLEQETFYCAVLLHDGSVLRLSKSTGSIWSMFGEAVPVVLIIIILTFLISYLVAGHLTARIVRPINNVQFNEKLTAPYDELTPFIQTISEQRTQINQQLSDLTIRSNTMQATMENMQEGIIFLNEKGVILAINKSASSIFSPPESMTGKNILEILRNIELNESIKEALSGIRGECNFSHDSKIYRVYFSPVTGSGAILLFLDITEKNMSEKLRTEFSANVSHELKTPLTTIYGNAEMLENGMVMEADKTSFYGKIKDEAARLIALIEDIIMLSRLDEGSGQAAAIERIELSDIAYSVISSLEPKIKEQNVSVTVSGSSILSANRSQMEELFYNLIDNSIKYNKKDGTVTVTLHTSTQKTKITVSDTGIGIPKEMQSRVFERFYRVDQSRSKKTGGTGLGLAIVKHIVMANGGNLELKSRVNEGTSITITLPLEN